MKLATLCLSVLTFTLAAAQWDDGFGGDDLEGPTANTGASCNSVLDCTGVWDYCIDGICQPKQAGKDCVAEGQMPTSNVGPGSCCPPLATTLGKVCTFYDGTTCNNDAICTERSGMNSQCCNAGSSNSFCRPVGQGCS
ncbi:hypothetical protein DM01DRAFT_1372410 [Hesseltinella vesiculosa]|uniref:Uncharacterized protein n=1 Tax=Hesseltinella vesiculosa TaxID=101127 RepID=A0A1X2GMH9_9FUNG|nr:hypothetical protein DM01DRAFT_1372410 [Hesseltinella vesiculosa]